MSSDPPPLDREYSTAELEAWRRVYRTELRMGAAEVDRRQGPAYYATGLAHAVGWEARALEYRRRAAACETVARAYRRETEAGRVQ